MSRQPAEMDKFIGVGRIVKPVGLKGRVLVRAYSQMENLVKPGSFFVRSSPRGFSELTISDIRQRGRREAVIAIGGITSRKKAQKLSRLEIFQLVSRLPAKKEDEYYWFELKGLAVTTRGGRHLGRIHSILETAANDVMMVRDENREILIPMVQDIVIAIDLENGTCTVDLPPGIEEATCTRLAGKNQGRKP